MDGQRAQTEFHGRSALEQWLLACASAAIYYALARAGFLFAHGPSNASQMWPAAGFALAAVVLWGPSAAVGVFLGAWLADEKSFIVDRSPPLAAALTVSALVALGNALQALWGAALLRRFAVLEDMPGRAREAAVFCVLAPVIGLISVSIELLALAPSGISPGLNWAKAGLAWWIGDTAGILVATPLILAWARPRTKPALFRFDPRAATALVAALAASVIWPASRGAAFTFAATIQDSLMVSGACLAAISVIVLISRALLAQRETALKAAGSDNLAARERLEMNRRIYDNLPSGLMILRLEEPDNADSMRIVAMNPAALRLVGAAGERIENIPLAKFAPEVSENGLLDMCLAVLKSGESRVLRDYVSARRVPGANFNVTIFALSGKEIALSFENVSEQKKAERRLQDRTRMFHLMIESVRDYAIFRLDPEGRVASWSSEAQVIYGYPAAEIVGSPFSRLIPPEDSAKVRIPEQLGEVARERRLKAECWCVRKDGTRFWADIVLTALRDEAGALLGSVSVVRDATQRRKSELFLMNQSAALARSNTELAQFAYVASHDLSAPLHKVKAFADRLKDKVEGKLDDEGRDYLRRMLRAVDGMQGLIESLLELARITTRGGVPAVVDLGVLAKDVVDGLDLAVARAKARVEIGALPRINADPLQMRQLMQNLIANALKFHRPGARPHVRVHGKATDDGRCEIVVSDNGIGFDMKYAERIFQPFQRLNGRFEYEGSGMGLAICAKIVARHGGTISAMSKPDHGAEFKVTLPISQEGRMECQPLEKAFS